ncbi:MAG: orotidine 5'-phosphate decarboxylase [Caeruleum heppii]|nr:MAG: orotidine 5'-phosphate decarboxylase [Caeruleum heppii]
MSTGRDHPTYSQSFAERAQHAHLHPLAHHLLYLMTTKSSNLCLSADVSTTNQLLQLAEEVGDSICMLKTHIDIIDDFSPRTVETLTEIASRKKFLIFEDRKFGDIGSTVQKQYTAGPFRIVEWADLTNAHIFPGPAIITALKSAAKNFLNSTNNRVVTEISAAEGTEGEGGPNDSNKGVARTGSIVSTTTIETHVEPSPPQTGAFSSLAGELGQLDDLGDAPLERGLLLLAEMSSESNLMTTEYTEKCISWARQHQDFVLGFIGQRSLNQKEGDNFITLTPGVSMHTPGEDEPNGDGLGQQYNTPRRVIYDQGSDIIIVGRGILGARNRATEAEKYRREAWKAYLDRIKRR